MSLKKLNFTLLIDITGNEERAKEEIITDLKNHFRGKCGSEQYFTDHEGDKNYAYRITEVLTEEECNV